MRIAFVNDGMYRYATDAASAAGGAERQQWLLARALSAAGWSVTVGVREALEHKERRDIGGVEFVGIGPRAILAAWYRFLLSERPDWWYWRAASHLWGPAVEIAKLAGARAIFAAAFDRDLHPCHALSRRRRWWPLYAWGLWRADRIFVQHGGQFARLPPQWRSKACIVPSIAGENVETTPHSRRQRYAAWVAMLRQPKRPDLLVQIARKAPGIRFVVCGGTSSHRSYPGYGERLVASLRELPNVDYLGQVAPKTAARIIADSAMLISTSDEEGFPNTFLEAWSSGTPVVSLKVDPDRFIEQFGLGVVSRGVRQVVKDIHILMDDPQQRDEIAARARQHVAQVHSQGAVVECFQRAVARNDRVLPRPGIGVQATAQALDPELRAGTHFNRLATGLPVRT